MRDDRQTWKVDYLDHKQLESNHLYTSSTQNQCFQYSSWQEWNQRPPEWGHKVCMSLNFFLETRSVRGKKLRLHTNEIHRTLEREIVFSSYCFIWTVFVHVVCSATQSGSASRILAMGRGGEAQPYYCIERNLFSISIPVSLGTRDSHGVFKLLFLLTLFALQHNPVAPVVY